MEVDMGWFSDPAHAGILNLFAALAVFVPALVVVWHCHPRQFAERPYTQVAFVFWTLQWFALLSVWAAYYNLKGRSIGVLATDDLYVVAALGFVLCYKNGNEFQWMQAARTLAGVYAVLLLWNLLVGSFCKNSANQYLLWIWVLPSLVVSEAVMGAMALVFWKRHGIRALSLSGIVIPLYAFLQVPTYSTLFVEQPGMGDDGGWIVILALAKLMYGMLFYTLFFSHADTHEPLKLFQSPALSPAYVKARWVFGTVGTMLFSMAANHLAHLIMDGLTKWLPARPV
jgi:hypothetical protein